MGPPNVEVAADNARSRMKTGLPEKDNDEDLIAYYYITMHHSTQSGFEKRREVGIKTYMTEIIPRLRQTYKNVFDPPACPEKFKTSEDDMKAYHERIMGQ